MVCSCCLCCEAGHQLRPFVMRPGPDGASAGCVCLQCLFCRLFVCLLPSLPAMPTALNVLAPVQLLHVCLPPFSLLAPIHLLRLPLFIHVRQDRRVRASSLQAARTVLLAAATRACSGGPCTGPFCDSYLFSCRVHDPGPWLVCKIIRLRCVVNMCASPGMSSFSAGNFI